MPKEKVNVFIQFTVLAFISIFLITGLDRASYQWLSTYSNSLSVLADLRLTSLLTVLCIYFYVDKKFGSQDTEVKSDKLKRSIRLAGVFVLATAYFVLIKKVWVPTLTNWIDYTAFMVTGLIAEELLFRGALYTLAKKTFGIQLFAGFSVPVWTTSILFGLQHFGYHHFQMNSASIVQVIYTTVMGLFFCNLREATGYLWPVILLHVLTNSFTLVRNFGLI